jgi:hypothetical protein
MAFGQMGTPTVSLWARVPHYVAAMPFPEASAALIDGLSAVSGLVFDTTAVRRAAAASRKQVDELIADNTEHAEMVRRLESSIDSEEANPFNIDIEVPSGDEIAAELERFLRDEGS